MSKCMYHDMARRVGHDRLVLGRFIDERARLGDDAAAIEATLRPYKTALAMREVRHATYEAMGKGVDPELIAAHIRGMGR